MPPQATSPSPPPAARPTWSDAERSAWAPPEELNPAEWAEKYRVLQRGQSSRPGPWRNANQPAAVGLMVLAALREIREIWIKKSAQFGASEIIRNILGRAAHLQPNPWLLVMPDEKSGRKVFKKNYVPLFEKTAVLEPLLTGRVADKTLEVVTLSNGFELFLGYAGSPASVATHPYAGAVCDEVDKYPAAAQQADPVAEVRARLLTYEAQEISKLIGLSTPSTPTGRIAVEYDACPIKLHYYAPCPHCGEAFRPRFDRLVWEKFPEIPDLPLKAATILEHKAAWLECDHCAGQVKPGESYPAEKRIDEYQRKAMLVRGWWATDDQGWRIYTDGRIEGKKPIGTKVGVHVHGLIDLSTTLHGLAAGFVECGKDVEKLKGFRTTKLGEEWHDTTSTATASIFRAKSSPNEETGFIPGKAKVIPTWASRLVMTVDSQKSYFWFVIRAWGHGLRSQRIHHGRATSFTELEDLYYNAYFPYAGDAFPARRCFGDAPLAIDSGGGMDRTEAEHSITDNVYQWCLKDPQWRFPLKGASKPFEERIRWKDITYTPPGQQGIARSPYVVRLHFIDPVYWRDLLAGYIAGTVQQLNTDTGEVIEVEQWGLNDWCDDEYNRHLSAVHKVRKKKGRGWVEVYEPKTGGGRHDYHDLESYQIAWAHGPAKCQMLPSPKQMQQMAQARSEQAKAPPPPAIRMPDGRPFFSVHRR